MNLQKRLAARVLKCSPKRVIFDTSKLKEIKEAITKDDIRKLTNQGTITEKQKQGIAQFRTRQKKKQKRKGRQQGYGSRKGKQNARLPEKQAWIHTARLQRALLKKLRDKQAITTQDYRILYLKSKGGFFRSEHHLKVYIKEQEIIKKK